MIFILPLIIASIMLIGCGGSDQEPPQTKVIIIREPSDGSQFPISKDGVIKLEPAEKPPRDKPKREVPKPNPTPPQHGIIAYSSNGEVVTMKPDGSGKRNLTNHRAIDNNPVWSPDGKRIAFLSNRIENFGLFVMASDGSNPRRVTNWLAHDASNRPAWAPNGVHIDIEGFNAFTVAWSPDFRKIAFAHSTRRLIQILDINRPDDEPTTITKMHSSHPAWSPDGSKIAYQSREGPNDHDPWEIYVINVDGTGNTNLTQNPKADDQHPTWSPDGRHIMFTSFREPDFNWEIYIMDNNGSNQTNITRNALADDTHPSWR